MKRSDVIAQILDQALERVFGDAKRALVFHPGGDFEPHIDVYAIPPEGERTDWFLLTAGLSWPMAAALKAGSSALMPAELAVVLPGSLNERAVGRVASLLQHAAEVPFRHDFSFQPGTLVPSKEPLVEGGDLHALLFAPSPHPLAARVTAEFPTHPLLYEAALLTSIERRVASVAPVWRLWREARRAYSDLGRLRCAPPVVREGESVEQAWSRIERLAEQRAAGAAGTSDLQPVSRQSQDERLDWLGLARKGSEDASALIALSALPALEVYEPDGPLYFVVDLELPRPMSRAELHERFTQEWFAGREFPSLRGRIAGEGRWVIVGAPAATYYPNRTYDAARFVERMFKPWKSPAVQRDAAFLEALLESIRQRAPDFGVRPRSSPSEIAAHVPELLRLREEFSYEIPVLVRREGGFTGSSVWDAMHALGLRWGNQDLFWCEVPAGSESLELFAVETRTDPGYFVPERIVAGSRYDDVRFSFSPARSPAPELVLEAILRAAEYAAKRLGGSLRLASGEPLDADALRDDVRATSEALRARGWPAGSARARELF